MKLGIYTLEKTIFEGEVREIVAKTSSGEITVLAHHEPLITRLVAGPIRIINEAGVQQSFDIGPGFLEVKPGSEAAVLVDAPQ